MVRWDFSRVLGSAASRPAHAFAALTLVGGVLLAVPVTARAAGDVPAPLGSQPAVPAAAPVHTFQPVAGAPDAPQDPSFHGECHSTNADGGCTLRAAVMEADSEQAYIAIVLTAGTYSLSIPPTGTTDASTGNLDLTDAATVTLTGAGATSTIVDASAMNVGAPATVDRVFQVEGRAVARLTGFAIQHGQAAHSSVQTDPGAGGGIDVSSSSASLVLRSVRVEANTAEDVGGGISDAGSLWATNTTVTGNNGPAFGGGLNLFGRVQLTNDAVTGNTARHSGGGIAVLNGTTEVHGGTVSANHVSFIDGPATGGGVEIEAATSLVGTTISQNTVAPIIAIASDHAAGGGVFVRRGAGLLDHLTIQGNSVSGPTNAVSGPAADGGGGIYDASGLTLTNSVVRDNRAPTGVGGGIANVGSGERLTHVTVSGNTAAYDGGGLYGDSPTVVSRSGVTGNTAGNHGGGILDNDALGMDHSLVAGNKAVQGAGIWNGRQAQFTDVTVAQNTASGAGNAGGGYFNDAASAGAQFTNVTISGNRSDDGGGIFDGGGVTVHNTIIAGNEAVSGTTDTNCDVSQNGALPLTDAGYNLDSGNTCGLTGPGDKSGVNPRLGALANNGGATRTEALLSGSPAINAGHSPAPTTDQRGVQRGPRPDIGAFEVAGKG